MRAIGLIVAVLLSGCTSVTVRPVESSALLKRICIQENPKVLVTDFVTVVRDGFDRHGIASEVVGGVVNPNCDSLLTYTALRAWDFASYLRHAELRLERDGRQIGYAEYHLNGGGGFDLTKWAGTKSKMDPVIDELLAGYPNSRPAVIDAAPSVTPTKHGFRQ